MKNIFKILMVFILPLLLINSCRDEADKNWSTPTTIKLYNASLSSNTLYPSMDNNTFRLVWDAIEGNTENYTIQIATNAEFTNPITFATTKTSPYTTTIKALNTSLLQAGYSPYAEKPVYFRVVSGSNVSNVISLGVTPYPVSIPVITNPVGGQLVGLDGNAPTATAVTVKWNDYDYGTLVHYTIEVAKKGSATFMELGTVDNAKELAVSNFALNEAASKLDLPVNVASEVDIRVTAKTESPGGIITKVSDIVTFKVTPYQPAYKDFYLVGGGTAVGWNAGGAQLLKNTQNLAEIYTYLENNGEFRFLGQQDWNPINYSLNTPGIKDAYKFFKTWSSNLTIGDCIYHGSCWGWCF